MTHSLPVELNCRLRFRFTATSSLSDPASCIPSPPVMGRLHKVYLDGSNDLYRCVECHSHFAYAKDLESNTFQSGAHRAFLFTHVVNVYHGPPADRTLRTGVHVVSDIYCQQCHVNVGWYYNLAYETTQKYKEHKFILVENTISKRDADTATAAAEGQPQQRTEDSSVSGSSRSSQGRGRRMRDEEGDDDEEEEEEEEEDDDDVEEVDVQREGRSQYSIGGALRAMLLPSASTTPAAVSPAAPAAAASSSGGRLTRAAREAAIRRIRVPPAAAPSAF